MDSLDPSRKQQIKAQEKAKKLLKSLGIDPAKDVKLTNYEMMVASSLGELCTSIEVCTTFNLFRAEFFVMNCKKFTAFLRFVLVPFFRLVFSTFLLNSRQNKLKVLTKLKDFFAKLESNFLPNP